MEFNFLLHLSLFLILATFCFTLPGFFILKGVQNISFWEKFSLSTVVGFVAFTLLSYILLILNLHLLLIPIILIVDVLSFRQFVNLTKSATFFPKNRLNLFVLVLILGVVGQLAVIAPSGIFIGGDLIFWSSHGHDGSWHIALMEEFKKGYPLQNPAYAGERLVNYHFFSDIAPSNFNHYFKIPSLDLYFRLFPLFFSVLLGSLAFLLGRKLGGNFGAGLWAMIFTYFAGSFGYILTYYKNQTIGGESIFWASQVQSSSGNPPQISAFLIILSFLLIFSHYLRTKSKALFITCVLLAGTLAVFKVYAAVVLLGSLVLVGLWELFKEKKIYILSLALSSSLLSAILYLPNTAKSASFLIFEPWWFIRTMIVTSDKLNLLDWELKRQTYIAENNWKRVLQIEITGFLIFFLGNLGTRFIGLWSFMHILKSSPSNYLNLLIILMSLTSLVIPLLFLQKGVASNTIQFLQYFLLIMGILAGISISKILDKIRPLLLKILFTVVIILLSIPTQIALIENFYNRTPFAKIDKQELIALNYLNQNTPKNSVILTPPYNQYLDLNDKVPHIWDWFDTAYVAAFSARRVFLADTEQVDIMGYDLEKRLLIQKGIFDQTDPRKFVESLKSTGIDYLYFPKSLKPKVELAETDLKREYENGLIEIWGVN